MSQRDRIVIVLSMKSNFKANWVWFWVTSRILIRLYITNFFFTIFKKSNLFDFALNINLNLQLLWHTLFFCECQANVILTVFYFFWIKLQNSDIEKKSISSFFVLIFKKKKKMPHKMLRRVSNNLLTRSCLHM